MNLVDFCSLTGYYSPKRAQVMSLPVEVSQYLLRGMVYCQQRNYQLPVNKKEN